MNIEICIPNSSTSKDRGDLLEILSKEMLEVQNYQVEREIRKIGSELDLLCKHKVSNKKIYVECKAYRDKKIDAPILRQLLGTVFIENYTEGWLITTSELSKDAKGIVEELSNRKDNANLVIYTPQKVIESLQTSNIISSIPINHLIDYVPNENIGEWILIITPFGRFWAVNILKSGIPTNVVCYYANSGKLVEDQELLNNIALTDSSLSGLDFSKIIKDGKDKNLLNIPEMSIEVVEVQRGEDWNDYRPARPQDFVGRTKDINIIFDFFKKIRDKEVSTRIFAITGNSGLGKSSFIIKLSEKAKNQHNRQKVFLYAIDVRAAKSPEYIFSSLLKTLQEAQNKGFGDKNISIKLTNVNHPLDSESVTSYLKSVEDKNQLIVLVFDQFEELFSKPELYEIFNNAVNLSLNTASIKTNLCIGFAWKTDSTTHVEHPAYSFWHKLSDYRIVRKLAPFSDRESHTVINKFEEVIQQKLHSDLRHNLIVGSQGYPWLLKKLCIHLYEKIENGVYQEELLENKLDISSLFSNDLSELTAQEIRALKFIAQRAPIDLVDTFDTCGEEIVSSLLNRRLIVKSGIRLNIYWDIFREFILTGNVPIIALRYLPSSDFNAIWNIAKHLDNSPKTIDNLVEITSLSEGTIQNIGTDLIMFGIANRENSKYTLSSDVNNGNNTQEKILNLIREKFKKHIITLSLKDLPSGTNITLSIVIDIMKSIYSESTYVDNTWRVYAVKISNWLELTGFLQPTSETYTWIYKDNGTIKEPKGKRVFINFFTPRLSPALLIETYKNLKGKNINQIPKTTKNTKAIECFRKFKLIDDSKIIEVDSIEEYLTNNALKERSIQETLEIYKEHKERKLLTRQLGLLLKEKNNAQWSEVTTQDVGKKLSSWYKWLKQKNIHIE